MSNQQTEENKETLQNIEQMIENFETEMTTIKTESLTYEKLDENQKKIYDNIESFNIFSFNGLGTNGDERKNKLADIINVLEKDEKEVNYYEHIVNFILDPKYSINTDGLLDKCKNNENFCLCFVQKQLLNKKNIKLEKENDKITIMQGNDILTLNIKENKSFLDCLKENCNSQENLPYEQKRILNLVKYELFSDIGIQK